MQSHPSRPNAELARIVEEAIHLAAAGGEKEAVDLLLKHGVNFRTLVRVIAEPSRRRAEPCATSRR